MEKCARCGEVGQDRRTLWMKCLYNMSELKVPFKQNNNDKLFTLRVCKDCRASWMRAIELWFNNKDQIEIGTDKSLIELSNGPTCRYTPTYSDTNPDLHWFSFCGYLTLRKKDDKRPNFCSACGRPVEPYIEKEFNVDDFVMKEEPNERA